MLKRVYQLSEKQFKRLVTSQAVIYAKNNNVGHDKAVFQFLERRLDTIILRSGFAQTIMQSRQIVTHAHLLLNGKKHNIPSYFVKPGDIVSLRPHLKESTLYATCPLITGQHTLPSRIKANKQEFSIEILDLPNNEEVHLPVDILKVIEFYARA